MTYILKLILIFSVAFFSLHAEEIQLTGTIRDFYDYNQDNSKNPDFENSERLPSGNEGNYAVIGLVNNTLTNGKPTLLGDGVGMVEGDDATIHSITNADSFSQWYQDTPGINESKPYSITLTKTNNVYTYENHSFFPIDNDLIGKEGGLLGTKYYMNDHNFHFTYDIHSNFTYQGGEIFEFSGDDDVWVFINNELVIDIGGIHSSVTKSVNLDTLGLSVGQTYSFDFFFAERHIVASNFKISTTIEFEKKEGEATCYALTDNSNKLYKVTMQPNMNPLPIATTIDISHSLNGEGSAYLARNNTFYAFSGTSDDVGPSNLYKINVDTGKVDLVKSLLIPTLNGTVEGAEFYFNPTLNKEILYVISQENNSKLYAFNPDNNWELLDGYPKNTDTNLSSLAIDPQTGKGYAIDDYNYDNVKPKVYELNLETGVTTHITTLQHLADAEGLAFASDGNLYIEDEGRDDLDGKKLYMINLTTGALTPAAITNANGDIEGLSCNGTAMKVSYDFGDAPDKYTHVSHKISPKLYLGDNKPDGEDDQQSSADASGDGEDDNDAVVALPTLSIGDSVYTVPVKVFNDTGETAYITAWIDFNRNGIFEFDEALNTNNLKIHSTPLSQSGNIVWDNNFSSKMNDLSVGKTIMRIRLSTSRVLRCDDPHYKEGQNYADNYLVSPDGEVEDYEIEITSKSKALKGQFNVERINSNTYPINSIERNAWYTQIVGRDFDYSVLFYDKNGTALKEISNATIKIELINQDTNITLYDLYAHIAKENPTSRIDVKLPIDDLNKLPATKKAIFRISYGVDANNSIIQADCSNSVYKACYERDTSTHIKTDYAKDNFAIRPDVFHLTINDNNKTILSSIRENNITLAAGYDYNLSVIASQYMKENTPSKGYTKPANSSITFTAKGLNCKDSSDINESINFIDGHFQDLSFTHHNVGQYLIKIEADTTWTEVDQNSTVLGCIKESSERVPDNTGRVGCDIVVNQHDTAITFRPYKFAINLALNNLPSNTHPNFIYMSELSKNYHNTAIQFSGNIIAQTKDNKKTSNFTNGCFAQDVLLYPDAIAESEDGNISASSKIRTAIYENEKTRFDIDIKRMRRFNNEDFNLSIIDNVDKISESFKIQKSKFLNENNGTTILDLRYNIQKDTNHPINPVQMTFKSLKLEASASLSEANRTTAFIPTGIKDYGSIVRNFYFAQVAPDLIHYPRVNFLRTNTVSTPLNVDIFCNSLEAYCKKTAIFNNTNLESSARKQNGWLLSINHDRNNDGNVTRLTRDKGNVNTPPTPIDFTNGRANGLSTGISNCPAPTLTKVTIDSDPALKYNPHGNAPYYTVECTPTDPSEWTGIGKTGYVLDAVANVNSAGKVDW